MCSPRKNAVVIKFLGILFLVFSGLILIKTFFPIAKAEINYQFIKIAPPTETVTPVDPDFSIVIPKLNINAKVVKNVDPYNSAEYQHAFTQGVAQAKGSSLPGFPGNTFIFAHSAANWYQASQYNAIFYLIHKLEKGDEIDLYYQSSKYLYTVTDQKIVKPSDINYLTNHTDKSTLTLMTCWPPGTSLNRLIILAKLF